MWNDIPGGDRMRRDGTERDSAGQGGMRQDRMRQERIRWKGGLLLWIIVLTSLSGCALAGRVVKGELKTVLVESSAAGPEKGETDAQENGGTDGQGAAGKTEGSAGQGEADLLFEGTDIEGEAITSQILAQSKITMVNVWATYCNPCLREMPGLGELAGEYDKSAFQIIGIISDVQEGADQDTLDMAADLIEKTGAAYPHLLLNESLYRGLLRGVTAVPTTFFFNADGELLETVVGSMEKADWKEKIDGYLEE